MTRALAVVALLAVLPACGAAQDPAVRLRTHGVTAGAEVRGWREYRSARGYRFAMPGVPEARSEVRQYNVGSIATTLFDLSRDEDAKVLVLTAFDVHAFSHDDAKIVYDGLCDEAREHGTLLHERDVAVTGGSAHEMEFDERIPGRHSRIRVVWLGGFVLRAVAIFDDGHRDDAEIDRFFATLAVSP